MVEGDPNQQKISHVFSKYSVEANESSHSNKYQTALSHSKSIQQSILSFGSYSEDHSCVLTIALKHKSLKDIVDQMGYIVPK